MIKSLILTLATIVSLSCSSLPNKKPNIVLPNEVIEWLKNPDKYFLGYRGVVDFNCGGLEGFRNQYDSPHFFISYDLNKDGKEDLNVLYRIINGKYLRHPTMMTYDGNKNGKTDIVWFDLNNDGNIDFEERK